MSRVTARGIDREAARADAGAQRGQDAAPGRIAAEDPGLDQAAARDGARQIARCRAIGHPRDVDDQQLGRALAVGGDGARQLAAQLGERGAEAVKLGPAGSMTGAPERAVGQRDHAVVGRHVAVDGDGVERLLDAPGQRRLQRRRRDRRVGGDEAEHRRHLRVDHPRALGDRGQPHGHAPYLDRPQRHLGAQVGGPDRLGGARDVVAQRREQRRRGRARSLDGQARCRWPPVDAVSTSSGPNAQRRRDGARHRALVGGARRPGERVGVAAVGDDGADPRRRQPAGGVPDRRRAQPVDREHAGRGARRVRDDERQVALVARLLDARARPRRTENRAGGAKVFRLVVIVMVRSPAGRRGPRPRRSQASGLRSGPPGRRRP